MQPDALSSAHYGVRHKHEHIFFVSSSFPALSMAEYGEIVRLNM
jgi:hypothetical protein